MTDLCLIGILENYHQDLSNMLKIYLRKPYILLFISIGLITKRFVNDFHYSQLFSTQKLIWLTAKNCMKILLMYLESFEHLEVLWSFYANIKIFDFYASGYF